MEYNINDETLFQKQEIVKSFGRKPNRYNTSWSLNQDTELCFLTSGLNGWTNTFSENQVVMKYEGSKAATGPERKPRKVIFQKNGGNYKFIGIFELDKRTANSFFFKKTGESVRPEDYAAEATPDDFFDSANCFSLLKKNLQLILTGAPGTGKTFMARQLAAKMIGCEVEELKNQEQFSFVQFHPGYDYSDFVIGLKPKLDEESKQIFFYWKDGIFKTLCDAAKKDSEKKYIMVIDEINRADLSRVFGELFFCLEESYRGDEVTLPNGEKFTIPKNIYIIGTMNDIDRSVESMDFALRRRFAWHEVKAEETGEEIVKTAIGVSDELVKEAVKKMKAVNDKLGELKFGEEYKLGGAYFKKLEKYKDNPEEMWEALWNNHIAVILREYLRGRRDASNELKTLKEAYFGPEKASETSPAEENN